VWVEVYEWQCGWRCMSGGVGGRKIVKYVLKCRKFYQSCTSDRLSASAYVIH